MLKTKQLLGGLLIIGVSVALIQCKKNTETPTTPDGNGDGTGGGTTTYAYTKDIAPIITNNCSCHLAGGPAVGRADLSSYANLKSASSRVRSVIQTGGKMRQYTNDANAAILTSWIDAGSPE